MILDVNGLRIEKGDVVAPITGDFKGRVTATKDEDGEGFVCIRAAHRPYSKGVWYASEHVQRLAIAPARRDEAPKLIESPTRTAKPAGEDEAGETATVTVTTTVVAAVTVSASKAKVTRRSSKKGTAQRGRAAVAVSKRKPRRG